MDVSLEQYLQLAKKTALLAGSALIKNRQEWANIEIEDGRDVKVTADRSVEAIILEHLQAKSDFPILTEERGWQKGSDEEYLWVIDPLDGSFNYSIGVPSCCVSIALCKKNEPILGVVYDFNRDELYSGIAGVGARLNNHAITVSSIDDVSKAVLNTGFPVRHEFTDENSKQFMRFASKWRKVRMIGSAALALAYVACSRSEYYLERNTMFWDVAAGIALVKAAGGVVQLEGDKLDQPHNVMASNGRLDVS